MPDVMDSGWGSAVGGILGGFVSQYLNPSGGQSGQQNPMNYLDMPLRDVTPQGSAGLFEPFTATLAGHRAQPFIGINPTTGRRTWFKPAGQPVLWSGDFAAARRVRRVAMKARRRLGGR